MCRGVHSENAWIPNGLCVCVSFMQREDLYLGNSPEYRGDSAQIFMKLYDQGLLGDPSPMCRSWPGLGHDRLHRVVIDCNNLGSW